MLDRWLRKIREQKWIIAGNYEVFNSRVRGEFHFSKLHYF